MSRTKGFLLIAGNLALVATSFIVLGWWALIPVAVGVIWQVTGSPTPRRQATTRKSHPVPQTNAAPHAGSVAEPASGHTWQDTVASIEAARRGDAEPIPQCSLTGHHGAPIAPPAGLDAEQVLATARWAHIDGAELVRRINDIRASIDRGNPRDTNSLLRECCPASAWEWPEATAFLERTGQRGTRLQLIELVAHRLIMRHNMLQRLSQMRRQVASRPYWSITPVEDPLTPADCIQEGTTVRRYDDPFWRASGPLNCDRVFCRCRVRNFTADEAAKRFPW